MGGQMGGLMDGVMDGVMDSVMDSARDAVTYTVSDAGACSIRHKATQPKLRRRGAGGGA